MTPKTPCFDEQAYRLEHDLLGQELVPNGLPLEI